VGPAGVCSGCNVIIQRLIRLTVTPVNPPINKQTEFSIKSHVAYQQSSGWFYGQRITYFTIIFRI
jgi:hypothetical protein